MEQRPGFDKGTVTILANGTTMDAVAHELFVLRRSEPGWRISSDVRNRPGPAIK